ncbi:hypothetical protein [Polaribacter sp. 11A2H]|uniref:hypothetical protein n=1 Tax=Polaribacter sp. 11A2H TaxID=2687290 RepID=UPI00140AD88D|nr:hypothetical protein [Polaribacter sp. 11A2H]
MKRKLFFLTLLFSYFFSFSQSVKYIDENMSPIDSITYSKKCNLVVLKCLNFKTDSLNINKVVYKYKFGTTDTLGYTQVRKFLSRNSNLKIDKNAFLMIRFRDTLYDSNTNLKNYKRHVKNHSKIKHADYDFKKNQSNTKKSIEALQKCNKKFKKLGGEIFNVYNYDYGYRKEYPEVNWIKDRGLFKNAFFKIIYSSSFLLIKPNGEYFISGGHLSDSLLKKLLKNNDWSDFRLDWLASYNTLSKSGKGVFKQSAYHTKHCF